MRALDLRELLKAARGVIGKQVRAVGEMIREVERLGGKRSHYDIAPPFSGSPRVRPPAECRPQSLHDLEGLGGEVWEGEEPQEYVRRLRREWDQRI